MAYMCSLCGGIVQAEQGVDFPVCSIGGCICIGNEIQIQDDFTAAIKILQEKGYRLTGYKLPRLDSWETDYIASIVFDPHTWPESLPPKFQSSTLPMLHGVIIYHTFETPPAAYKRQVKQSAADLLNWAVELPAIDFTKL